MTEPIGACDSGVGGRTVLRARMAEQPQEHGTAPGGCGASHPWDEAPRDGGAIGGRFLATDGAPLAGVGKGLPRANHGPRAGQTHRS